MNFLDNATVEDLNNELFELKERFGSLERKEADGSLWIERVSDGVTLLELDTEEHVLTMFY